MLELRMHGAQVIIASHSLFLLRELEILLADRVYGRAEVRFFGLHAVAGGGVGVQQGDSVADIGDIASLDEELAKSDRFMDADT